MLDWCYVCQVCSSCFLSEWGPAFYQPNPRSFPQSSYWPTQTNSGCRTWGHKWIETRGWDLAHSCSSGAFQFWNEEERFKQGLTFAIIYKDSKISSSLSVPKIAEIWDMGLKYGSHFGNPVLRRRRTMGARDQCEAHFGKVNIHSNVYQKNNLPYTIEGLTSRIVWVLAGKQ